MIYSQNTFNFNFFLTKNQAMSELQQKSLINIFKALANFQQDCPVIHKGTTGYGYTYADLPQILEVINPLLKKHGLGFTQLLTEDGLLTVIFHAESGECIEGTCPIPTTTLKGMNDYQSFGSGITYYRRYALSSALGIVTDKDTDAAGEKAPLSLKITGEEKIRVDSYGNIKPAFVKKHKNITDLTLAIDSCETLAELTELHKLNKELVNPAITALFTAKKSHL